ncbi:unnamed protein product, partial [Scytosiphon promiscuus]
PPSRPSTSNTPNRASPNSLHDTERFQMSSSAASLPGALATSSSSTSSTQASASPVETTAPSRARVNCQYPECSRRAKYGPRNGPPNACQAHKRTGQ